jgi:hypothetical protein
MKKITLSIMMLAAVGLSGAAMATGPVGHIGWSKLTPAHYPEKQQALLKYVVQQEGAAIEKLFTATGTNTTVPATRADLTNSGVTLPKGVSNLGDIYNNLPVGSVFTQQVPFNSFCPNTPPVLTCTFQGKDVGLSCNVNFDACGLPGAKTTIGNAKLNGTVVTFPSVTFNLF